MNRIRSSDRSLRSARGFTLIELLVVVILLGILSTIAVQRYSTTRGKTYDAAAKSDLRNAVSAQEAYFVEAGSYAADPAELDLTSSEGVTLTVTSADGMGFEMTAAHSSSTNTWCVNSAVGSIVNASDC